MSTGVWKYQDQNIYSPEGTSHSAVDRVEEIRCTSCYGSKTNSTGDGLCKHCNGSGIEPIDLLSALDKANAEIAKLRELPINVQTENIRLRAEIAIKDKELYDYAKYITSKDAEIAELKDFNLTRMGQGYRQTIENLRAELQSMIVAYNALAKVLELKNE
jgi:hypothetical protein